MVKVLSGTGILSAKVIIKLLAALLRIVSVQCLGVFSV